MSPCSSMATRDYVCGGGDCLCDGAGVGVRGGGGIGGCRGVSVCVGVGVGDGMDEVGRGTL